jgi:rubrerythrin
VRSHGESADLGPAAAWLARAAHDEAASVHAFEALADELAAHGAPADLLARITTAADDERRHAALVTALAQRHGAEVPAVTITPTPTRDLLALAVENIVEGCVRETWAALSAAHQAKHAHTVELRDLYQSIAADETTHAELAWSIHTWLIGQLNKAEQSLVTAARDAAVRQLHTTLAAHPDEPERQALGIPNRSTALHLLAGLDAALWSQAA